MGWGGFISFYQMEHTCHVWQFHLLQLALPAFPDLAPSLSKLVLGVFKSCWIHYNTELEENTRNFQNCWALYSHLKCPSVVKTLL